MLHKQPLIISGLFLFVTVFVTVLNSLENSEGI